MDASILYTLFDRAICSDKSIEQKVLLLSLLLLLNYRQLSLLPLIPLIKGGSGCP